MKNGPVPARQTVSLRAGVVVPLAAMQLLEDLERRGVVLSLERVLRTTYILAGPLSGVRAADVHAIGRWRHALIAILDERERAERAPVVLQ